MENFTPEMVRAFHEFVKRRFMCVTDLKKGLFSCFKVEQDSFKGLKTLGSDELIKAYLQYHKALAHLYATTKRENYKMFSDMMIYSFMLSLNDLVDFADDICLAMQKVKEA